MTPRIILIAQNVSLWDDTYESFGIVASPYSALTLYCHSNDYLIRERCQSSDTNPHWGICRSTQPHISKFLLDTTQGHLLQTQDHPNNFPSSFWGSFTSEPITSPTIPSAENQSSFLLVPVTSSSQFQVLNGSDPFSAVTAAIILADTLLSCPNDSRSLLGSLSALGFLLSNTASTVLPAQYFQKQSSKCHSLLQTHEQFPKIQGSNLNSSVHQSSL